MNRSLAFAAVLLLAISASAQTSAAQSATSTTPPSQPATAAQLPSDPAALLQLAAEMNGLHGNDLQPWHLHATWQTLDKKKKVKDQGALEEWWAGEKRYKTVVSLEGAQQTIYSTEHGFFIITALEDSRAADIPKESDALPAAYFMPTPGTPLSAESFCNAF